MKKTIFSLCSLISGFILLSLLNSCVNTKKLTYFSNIPGDSTSKIQQNTFETKISRNDILQISIFTPDDAVTHILNETNSAGLTPVTGSVPGLLVDESGIIKLPLIGAVKAEGLTKRELADLVSTELVNKKIAKDPIVTVRIMNYKVTVLGEVNRPGVVTVPNERITLPEALGEAGDLTIYGRRDNVLLVRENGNKRIYKRFSLNNEQLFNKDIYNLQNQDIIYVEPNQAKSATSTGTSQVLPLVLSTISILLIIYVELIKR